MNDLLMHDSRLYNVHVWIADCNLFPIIYQYLGCMQPNGKSNVRPAIRIKCRYMKQSNKLWHIHIER